MATDVSFEIDSKEFSRDLAKLGAKGPRIGARALNKSAKSARTATVKAVRTDMGLKARDVRDGLKLDEARPGRDVKATITVSAERIPLIKFGGTQLKRAGYKSRLKRGAGTIGGAFEATTPSGHVGVFRRSKDAKASTGRDRRGRLRRGRLKIFELHGPSLGKVFAEKWRSVGAKRFREQLPKNVRSEINFAMRGR